MNVNIGHALDTAISSMNSIVGLSQDVIAPAFGDWTCEGFLQSYSKATGKDRRDIALEWVERNYNAIYAANLAIQTMSSLAVDILEILPPLQERESKEYGKHE